jgi:hypothetical protein
MKIRNGKKEKMDPQEFKPHKSCVELFLMRQKRRKIVFIFHRKPLREIFMEKAAAEKYGAV